MLSFHLLVSLSSDLSPLGFPHMYISGFPPPSTFLLPPPPPARSSCLANLDLFISIRNTDNEDLHHSVFFGLLRADLSDRKPDWNFPNKMTRIEGRKEERKEIVTKREDILLILNPHKIT